MRKSSRKTCIYFAYCSTKGKCKSCDKYKKITNDATISLGLSRFYDPRITGFSLLQNSITQEIKSKKAKSVSNHDTKPSKFNYLDNVRTLAVIKLKRLKNRGVLKNGFLKSVLFQSRSRAISENQARTVLSVIEKEGLC